MTNESVTQWLLVDMNKDKNIYSTQSLALASAIQLVSTSKLQSIERSPDGKATFVFDRTDELDKVIELFWQKNLLIDAFSYFEALRYIKSRLYAE